MMLIVAARWMGVLCMLRFGFTWGGFGMPMGVCFDLRLRSMFTWIQGCVCCFDCYMVGCFAVLLSFSWWCFRLLLFELFFTLPGLSFGYFALVWV